MAGSLHFWTIGDETTASTRLRIHQYLPRLAADGLRPRVARVPRGYLPRRLFEMQFHRGDRLLIQKRLFAPHEVARLRERAERLIYDVDDAVHLDGPGSTRNTDRFRAVTEAADRVLAGNDFLAAASAHPDRAVLLPTPVDTDRLQPSPRSDRQPGLAVWIGSRHGLPSLERILPAFHRAAARRPGARLVVMADRAPAGLEAEMEFLPWTPRGEMDLLTRAAIGLMPLEDTPFNRGKCGFKILLYQAAGLAVAASPVGVNAALVEPGRDGYLPRDPGDWEAALDRLLGDPDETARFGERGRERVVRSHSVTALYPRFRQALMEDR
jgi:glycosyltransferase involved in cell wall biosynthesis